MTDAYPPCIDMDDVMRYGGESLKDDVMLYKLCLQSVVVGQQTAGRLLSASNKMVVRVHLQVQVVTV